MSTPRTSAPQSPDASREVNKRQVFYFSGYDPRGPSHYHKLYSTESEIQAPLNGLNLEVGRRRRVHRLASAWKILHKQTDTETDYEFLRWDDIIRKNWPKNEWQLLKAVPPSYWEFFKANWIWRLYKVAWPPAFAAAYPVVTFLGLLFLIVVLSAAAVVLPVLFGLPWWLGVVPGVAIFVGGIKLGRWMDGRIRSQWQLRTHCAMQKWSYGEMPELDDRIDEFAEYILDRIRTSDVDEVLVVGHSVGTILGVPLIAKLLELDPDLGKSGPAFAYVSLGNCLPLVTFLPGAKKLRKDLETVACKSAADWFDFSARKDGACVSVGDLVTMSGVSRPEGVPVKPKRIPVSILKMFPPESYAHIKKDIFRIHFQYIMAGELLTDYDFFAITAGPQTLASRYA